MNKTIQDLKMEIETMKKSQRDTTLDIGFVVAKGFFPVRLKGGCNGWSDLGSWDWEKRGESTLDVK